MGTREGEDRSPGQDNLPLVARHHSRKCRRSAHGRCRGAIIYLGDPAQAVDAQSFRGDRCRQTGRLGQRVVPSGGSTQGRG